MQMVQRLRVRMLDEMMPLWEALSECPIATKVAEQMRADEPLERAWMRARPALCGRGQPLDALIKEDVTVLDDLFKQLGQSGRMDQGLLLERTERALERQKEAASRISEEQGRLYAALGALSGLTLAICVL